MAEGIMVEIREVANGWMVLPVGLARGELYTLDSVHVFTSFIAMMRHLRDHSNLCTGWEDLSFLDEKAGKG